MQTLKRDQRGVAAIIIVTAIIIITSLIVTGFSSIIRREQRQSLDQQLKLQARYAAESVINDKIAQYRANPVQFLADANTIDGSCTEEGTTFPGASADEIHTTCVSINATPSSLEYEGVSNQDSTLIWLDPGSANADKIVISWERTESAGGNGTCLSSAYGAFPSSIGGNEIDMLRFDLYKVQSSGGAVFSRTDLKTGQYGGILYPRNAGVTHTAQYQESETSNQPIVYGSCSNNPALALNNIGITSAMLPEPNKAFAVIDLPGNNDPGRYLLRLKGIHKNSDVKIIGVDLNDDLVLYHDVQIGLEVTVRVSDIVQNERVRIPASTPPSVILADYALHVAGGICKQLRTQPFGSNDACGIIGDSNLPPEPTSSGGGVILTPAPCPPDQDLCGTITPACIEGDPDCNKEEPGGGGGGGATTQPITPRGSGGGLQPVIN